jgi:hypothetical protein
VLDDEWKPPALRPVYGMRETALGDALRFVRGFSTTEAAD